MNVMGNAVRKATLFVSVLKDAHLRSTLKQSLYYLIRLKEFPPQSFASLIESWKKRLLLLQKHQHAKGASARAYDDELTELYPQLRLEAAREIAALPYQPTITLIIPALGSIKRLRATLTSIVGQLYQNTEIYVLAERNAEGQLQNFTGEISGGAVRINYCRFDPARSLAESFNEVLTKCTGEFIGFVSSGDQLTGNAVFEVVRLLNRSPDTDIIYSDEARVAGDHFSEAFHKPRWSPDLFRSLNYLQNFLCCRKEVIKAVGGFRGSFESDLKYDLILRIIERAQRVEHISEVLYHNSVPRDLVNSFPESSLRLHQSALRDHLQRMGAEGEIGDGLFKGSFRVRWKITGNPKVSIIIPTRDRLDLLKRCLESITTKTSYQNFEIIVVDNASTEPESIRYLESLPHQVVKYPHAFNFSAINNVAAQSATGEHLLFLNNDTEVIAADWLDAMLEHSQRAEVGAVGAKLLYPDGCIQHAGMGLQRQQIALHLYRYREGHDHGYYGLADAVRNLHLVTGACLMVRASVFHEVGQFDESLPLTFNDADLCLKIGARGYLVVYTPYALLYHYEGISTQTAEDVEIETTWHGRPVIHKYSVPPGQSEAIKQFYSRWKDFIENDRYVVTEEMI